MLLCGAFMLFYVPYVWKAWDYDPCAYDANILEDQVHPTDNSMQRERERTKIHVYRQVMVTAKEE